MSANNQAPNAHDTYFEQLAKATGTLSQSDEVKLGQIYDNVVKFLGTTLILNDNGISDDLIKTAFVKAGGNPRLAEAFNEQAFTFHYIHSADVNWSRLFSKDGGYPDLSLQASDVSSVLPENYFPESYEIPIDLIA